MHKKFFSKIYYDDDRPKKIEANRNNEGFLSTIVFYVIQVIWCISLVEIFKGTAVSRNTANAQKSRANAIDIHTLLKWLIVLIVLVFPSLLSWEPMGFSLITAVLTYFLFMNLFSYFYYHLWQFKPQPDPAPSPDRLHALATRRFTLFALSFLYSIVGFAALFRGPWGMYLHYFGRPVNETQILDAIAASTANALTFTPGQFVPKSDFGFLLLTTQAFYSFVFLAIILAVSLPRKS